MTEGNMFNSIKCLFKWRGLEDQEDLGLIIVGITGEKANGIVEKEGNYMNLTTRGSKKRNRGGAESRYTILIFESNRKTRKM